MIFKWYFFFLSLITALTAEDYAYFIPPQNWKVILNTASSSVKISFVGKAKKNWQPVINLASEKSDVSLKEYVAVLQKKYENDPDHEWSDLGQFSTTAGEGRLTQLLKKTPGGNLTLLQLIIPKNGTIYVMTAICFKEDFIEFSQTFYAAFKSFNTTSDLIEVIPQEKSKEQLKKLCQELLIKKNTTLEKKEWSLFEKNILKNYPEMGNYWKILLLQDIKDKLTQTKDKL